MEEPIDYSGLSKSERKKLKRELKEQRKVEEGKRIAAGKRNKKVIGWFFTILVAGVLIYGIYFLFSGEKFETYTDGPVHWHANIKVFVCGNEIEMPSPFGNQHIGSPLLHTHDDRLIHIEGTIIKAEDITLGKYMSNVGMNFKNDELIDKRDGDLCEGKPGKVKLFVDGAENIELVDYIIKDGESYELRFE
ncbi:MAG: hypothetical protein AABX08_00185 [Nanoarchaeota archaeon]